jgi:hypothetical protein
MGAAGVRPRRRAADDGQLHVPILTDQWQRRSEW